MLSLEQDELEQRLAELATNYPNRAIFWSLAKRSRALSKTSIDSLYVAIMSDFKTPKSKMISNIKQLSKIRKNNLAPDKAKELIDIYTVMLEKHKIALKETDSTTVLTKEDIKHLFKELNSINLGTLKRGYFNWKTIPSIDVARIALIGFDGSDASEDDDEPELVLDLKDGRELYIKFPEDKKGKKWNHFLRKIQAWVEEQLG